MDGTSFVPSIRFYNENLSSLNLNNQEEESSNSSNDLIFPKNAQSIINKIKEENLVSDPEDDLKDDDVDYCPLELNETEEDEEYNSEASSDLEEEQTPKKKKRKKAQKRNPYQNKNKAKKLKKSNKDREPEFDFEDENGVIQYTELDGGFKLPTKLWNKLYPYQQAGIEWLWELHQNGSGGILGDEPGLGKTIQIICFLYGLSLTENSNVREDRKTRGPVILICPATLMHQWVNELDKWYPNNVVTILHHTSPYKGDKRKLLNLITKLNGILITSYTTISICQDVVFNYDWHYVILDEGHKIRNPDAQATLAVKRFKTPHRIILSGSPIQNNLKELWSLFDFIYPGKLGTLPVFLEQFAVPITQGGYSNATEIQVQIAYRCATVLRDTIKSYLLRRLKEDVKLTLNLPNKNEQVLFCKLTECQKKVYQEYLKSKDVAEIIKGTNKMFVGLVNLRKISNHPDLFTNGPKQFIDKDNIIEDDYYGNYKRSGKMKVLNSLLKQWFKQKHKVLLFTQGRQMLDIIEKYLKVKEYSYLVMDGSTSVNQRPQLIKQFNEDPDIFIFLLTTRVGGLGVNLTGADRIIIFDPDWNPSIDLQARERAWRIGQERQVTIYRLLTTGTVEEKIYHRQIFKQYLTNKILKNPKQRRFFKTNDLYELFRLGNDDKQSESSDIFAGTDSEVKLSKKKKKKSKNKNKDENEFKLPPEKILELRERAKKLSQMISKKFNPVSAIGDNNNNLDEASTSSSSTLTTNNTNNGYDEKGAVIEGKRIKYLDKCDQFKEQIIEDTDEIGKKQDEYVLRKLFKNSSLHSALQHDAIEGAASNDFIIVEREAERVANNAIEALKRSRELCLNASSGLPNWTGQNGYAKKIAKVGNQNRPAFGKPTNTNAPSTTITRPVNNRNARREAEEEESIQPSEFFSSIDRITASSNTSSTTSTTINNNSSTLNKPSTSSLNSLNNKPSTSSLNSLNNKPSTSSLNSLNNKPSTSSFSTNNNLPKNKSSSSSLLDAIKNRNNIIDLNKKRNSHPNNDNISDRNQINNLVQIEVEQTYQELLENLRVFIAFKSKKNGEATTTEVLEYFSNKIANEQTAVFKALLWKLCNFVRKENNQGYWVLKAEFR